jgi:hypothetical protein
MPDQALRELTANETAHVAGGGPSPDPWHGIGSIFTPQPDPWRVGEFSIAKLGPSPEPWRGLGPIAVPTFTPGG